MKRWLSYVYLTCCLITLLTVTGCEEVFDAGVATIEEDAQKVYVIDGAIVNEGTSVFYVSMVTSINNPTRKPLIDAKIHIESTGGFMSETATFNGWDYSYSIPTGTLNEKYDYRVVVETGGKTFASDFRPIMHTAEMDTLGYDENVTLQKLEFWTTYTGKDGDSPYTMWTIDEDYETKAPCDMFEGEFVSRTSIFSKAGHFYCDVYENPTLGGYVGINALEYPRIDGIHNPYQYCWNHEKLGEILLYDATNHTDNTLKHHILYQVSVNEKSLSYLYSSTVQQWGLSKDDYKYFRELKRLTEDTGGLFSPMPNSLEGNVHCISHPEVTVHGYILGSNAPTRRIFVSPENLEKLTSTYHLEIAKTLIDPNNIQSVLSDMFYGETFIFTKEINAVLPSATFNATEAWGGLCFTCLINGGTKNKPDWWPNDDE